MLPFGFAEKLVTAIWRKFAVLFPVAAFGQHHAVGLIIKNDLV